MKKTFLNLITAAVLLSGTLAACSSQKTANRQATRSKNDPSPAGRFNTDSSGTTPTARLTPSPVPNVRPNPIPDPQPPNPPL